MRVRLDSTWIAILRPRAGGPALALPAAAGLAAAQLLANCLVPVWSSHRTIAAGLLICAGALLARRRAAIALGGAAMVAGLGSILFPVTPDGSLSIAALDGGPVLLLLGSSIVLLAFRQMDLGGLCGLITSLHAGFFLTAQTASLAGASAQTWPGVVESGLFLALSGVVIWRSREAIRGLIPLAVALTVVMVSFGLWQNLRHQEDARVSRLLRPGHRISPQDARSAVPEITLLFGLLAAGLVGFAVQMARRAEERERQARRAEALQSSFLANMSHEIRTPMNGVLGMTDLLLATQLNTEQKDYLDTIRYSADSLLTILNDILDLSKIEAGKVVIERVAFPLRREVKEVLNLLRTRMEQKGLQLQANVDELPEWVEGDPGRFRQVLMNLLGNAVKFTSEGEIRVEASATAPDEAGVMTVRVAVADTGIGIAPAALPLLFDSFTQADASTARRYGGTGLGLAISRQLVHLMGGEIHAASQPGQGSTFTFTMVVRAAGDEAEIPAPTFTLTGASGQRLLLAEDNEVNQRIACRFLEKAGFVVETAADGQAACEAVRQGGYALVLMDVQMPGMDGLEATRAIREWERARGGPRLPIIAMTANAMNGDRERCLAAGMDDYMAKPISSHAVELKVRYWLQAREPALVSPGA